MKELRWQLLFSLRLRRAGKLLGDLLEPALESLQRRGIGMLAISPPEDPEALARQHEKIRARVMYLFRHTADEAGSQALLHAVLAFRQASGK